MGEPNPFISNGTCYSKAGEELDSSFIPCGNAEFGHRTCCGAGDNCLVDGACFGIHGAEGQYGAYLTYMAGCTDPEYQDGACPNKFIDQPWIALTRCDDPNTEWAVCSQENNPSTLQPGAFCTCTRAETTTIAVTATTTSIDSSASLPRRAGESIQFFPGFFPTQQVPPGNNPPPSPSTTPPGQTSPPASSGGSNPSPSRSQGTSGTSPPSGSATAPPAQGGGGNNGGGGGGGNGEPSADPSGGGLSGKAIAGIGVAAGVVAILIIVGIVFFLRRRRRRGPKRESVEGGEKKFTRVPTPTASEADGQAVSEVEGKAARPWSMRSELEGSQPGSRSSAETAGTAGGSGRGGAGATGGAGRELSPVAELPGSVPGWPNGTAGGGNGR